MARKTPDEPPKKGPTPRDSEQTGVGGRPADLDSNRFTLICEELARTGSKYKSCEALNVDYSTVAYAIRQKELAGDDSWRELWDDSYEQFKDSLEQAAVQRARDGTVTEYRVNAATGERIPVKIEYSDRLMEVLLKGAFPERFRERISVSGTIGLEPVDAFANLTSKAKREIRAIIMRDLEEQRAAAAQPVLEAEYVEVGSALEDMRQEQNEEDE